MKTENSKSVGNYLSNRKKISLRKLRIGLQTQRTINDETERVLKARDTSLENLDEVFLKKKNGPLSKILSKFRLKRRGTQNFEDIAVDTKKLKQIGFLFNKIKRVKNPKVQSTVSIKGESSYKIDKKKQRSQSKSLSLKQQYLIYS